MISDLLKELGRDLTQEAKDGHIEPIIGRDTEVRNLVKILSLKSKNNPIIVGDPGVGKTKLVEGLALKIIKEDVPNTLLNKHIFELDLNTLNSYRQSGNIENIIKQMMSEIKESKGQILMFIDEIHRITGDGTTDLGNLMKPYLARNFGVIGCTTLDEFRFIEKDPALERRFQKIVVNEPTINDTISILRGVKESYEIYHRVTIKDTALISAVKMTDRYITDKFLPDKALSILDESCATLRVSLDSKPDEIYEMEQEIIKVRIELNSLKNEEDSESIAKIKELVAKYQKLEEDLLELSESWEQDKALVEKIVSLQENRLKCKTLMEDILEKQGYTAQVESLTDDLKRFDDSIEQLEAIKQEKIENGSILRSDVNNDSIAEAISLKTGIPVSRMLTEDREKILELPKVLSKRVIGQEYAINTIHRGILRAKSGIQSRKRPNSYMFLGSTGVGKTELAKAITEQLYDSESSMIRIDMSEYMEKHTASRLTGPPPGYIGYEEGGQLTESVYRNPYSLILFDEVEKAHPDVLLTLLQVLDDGRLTDGKGRVIDFKNTMIIMTSNIGSDDILTDTKRFGEIKEETKEAIRDLMNRHFKPEFINRIDDTIFFNVLTLDTMKMIVDKLLGGLNERIKEELIIELTITDNLRNYIAENGFEPEYGARPVVKFFEDILETEIALKIMKDEIVQDSNYIADIDSENNLIFELKEKD